jgi:hypothetical protein
VTEPETASREVTPRWYERMWGAVVAFGRLRALVGAIGIIGFVAGIAVAWEADSAVALIIASAVLIVIAVFAPDEIRAAYGGAELLLRQSRNEAIVGAVTDSGSFEEFRSRVERIEEQFATLESQGRLEERIDELARQVATRTRASRPRRVTPAQADAIAEALASDAAAEHVVTADGVFLRLTIRGFGRLVSCDVIDPSGQRRTSIATGKPQSALELLTGLWLYETVYPTAFGADELERGPHLVEWKSKPTFQPVGRTTLVARDSFTIENQVE